MPVLVGEQVAVEGDDGALVFEEVEPGSHRLYVYAENGSTTDTELFVSDAAAVIRAEVMVDICVETELTVFKGVITTAQSKRAAGATVAVPALFVAATTDKKGRYELTLPPGEWEIEVTGAEGGSVGATVLARKPEDHWDASPVVPLDLQLQ